MNAQISDVAGNTAINLHRIDGADNIAEACRATALTASRRVDLLNPSNPQLTSLLINNARRANLKKSDALTAAAALRGSLAGAVCQRSRNSRCEGLSVT